MLALPPSFRIESRAGVVSVGEMKKLRNTFRYLVVLAWVVGTAPAADDRTNAENWPAWRRDGTGISNEKNLPVVWSETENVVWRTLLPGEGNSSPIVWGNRVFVTAALDEGAKRLVICLDAQSGKVLWKTELLPNEKTLLYPKTGFAAPTPTTDGRRVFAFFDSPGLVALDMEGKVVWKRALGPFKAVYNMGTSTVLYKDMVIQSCDHKGDAFIAAFRQSDGSECWRTPRKPSGFGHFGTPLLIQVQGRPQQIGRASCRERVS
jgi:outer membrane protein assembly factor BamB